MQRRFRGRRTGWDSSESSESVTNQDPEDTLLDGGSDEEWDDAEDTIEADEEEETESELSSPGASSSSAGSQSSSEEWLSSDDEEYSSDGSSSGASRSAMPRLGRSLDTGRTSWSRDAISWLGGVDTRGGGGTSKSALLVTAGGGGGGGGGGSGCSRRKEGDAGSILTHVSEPACSTFGSEWCNPVAAVAAAAAARGFRFDILVQNGKATKQGTHPRR